MGLSSLRGSSLHREGKARLGQHKIQRRDCLQATRNFWSHRPDLATQCGQDPYHLFTFGSFHLSQLVSHLQDFFRFEIDGLPAAAGVVDDASYLSFVLRLQRNHVPTVPHGVDGVREQVAAATGGVRLNGIDNPSRD